MTAKISSAPMYIYNEGAGHTSFRVFNNTILSKAVVDVYFQNYDTLMFKNNLCVRDSDKTDHYIAIFEVHGGLGALSDIDHNYYNLR